MEVRRDHSVAQYLSGGLGYQRFGKAAPTRLGLSDDSKFSGKGIVSFEADTCDHVVVVIVGDENLGAEGMEPGGNARVARRNPDTWFSKIWDAEREPEEPTENRMVAEAKSSFDEGDGVI